MKVDAFASRSHYFDHVAAVWAALDDDERGTFWVTSRHLTEYAEARGLVVERGVPRRPGVPVILASASNLEEIGPGRPVIYLEHGAGQTYPGDKRTATHNSYSGGRRRRKIDLFLCPNEIVAARERTANPSARIAIVGCPRLDGLLVHEDFAADPVLGVTWHWDCHLIPETRSAWPAWKSMVRQIAGVWPGKVIGHAHPRIWSTLKVEYERRGIEPVVGVDDFLHRSDVVVFDNTSVGYEAAALAIPTVVLNAPWYRRSVEHGLRFWDAPPGPMIDPSGNGGVEDAEAVTMAAMLAREPHWRDYSARVAERVYPRSTWGRAGVAAVDAIRDVFG